MRTGLIVVASLGLALSLGGCPEKLDDDQESSTSSVGRALPVDGIDPSPEGDAAGEAPTAPVEQPPVAAEEAPEASPRLTEIPNIDKLDAAVTSYFEGHIGRRLHIHTDKPMYQPGETIWVSTWDLQARDLTAGPTGNSDATLELISPKGASVIGKRLQREAGRAHNDLVLPDGVQGGEYLVRLTAADGVSEERPVIVNSYEAPRTKKKLEFVRKAYGAGDEVTATIEVKRPTGEPLAEHPLTALIRLDGADLPRVSLTTNADGGGLVRFSLPDTIDRGDALLTVLVDDGGVTESISKRIPIIVSKMELSFFPEGGDMIEGLPSRVYFEARNTIGKPADVEGRILDDRGQAVARFRTHDRGLGRLDFTPATGRTYKAEITRPAGITEQYALPLPNEEGCVLRHFDDLDGEQDAVRVSVACTEAQDVVVTAVHRELQLDSAALRLTPEDEAAARAMGIARITLFDAELAPLAERLVFRNRRAGLDITVEPDQEAYVPREQVALKVTTRDASGAPVPADVSLAVVDDTVISFADDKTGHMLSRLFLEPEIEDDVEEPNVYFDLTDDKSALGLDLLVGTRGWRKFEWQPVFNPPPTALPMGTIGATGSGMGGGGIDDLLAEGMLDLGALEGADGQVMGGVLRRGDVPMPVAAAAEVPEPEAVMPAPPPRVQAQLDPAPRDIPADDAADREAEEIPMAANKELRREADKKRPKRKPALAAQKPMEEKFDMDEDWNMAGEVAADEVFARGGRGRAARGPMAKVVAYAPVRVFPAPTYTGVQEGPRSDFRETIHWAPQVRTDASGQATVTFYLSDAVTSFRAISEGIGAGAAGRDETVLTSKLPFSMNVKLPLAVSQGDVLELPLTLTNEQTAALPVSVTSSFGDLLSLSKPVSLSGPTLAANAREALWHRVEVTGVQGTSEVRFAANAGGLEDAFERTVVVEPLGFPQLAEASGALAGRASHEFDLGAAEAGTVNATITLYPSPVATLVSGLEGMIREPGGCFEQTSSSNYPNVMVMQYLQANDVAAPALVSRTKAMMDRGYNKLVGYESEGDGYEWFGRAPAHEALTAYGLLEFADMRDVYGKVDERMLKRTATWLKSRRDGKGGFKRDAKALDSFGRASADVTDAYVVYSLAEAGLLDGFDAELDVQRKAASSVSDPYRLALATNTLLNSAPDKAAGVAAAKRLAKKQSKDGRWTGADHSITRSGGTNLDIETTALSVLALMKAGGQMDSVRKGVQWLTENRGGYGQWGATQATVLALKAMTEYTTASRVTRSSGAVTLRVNGQKVSTQAWSAGRSEPITFSDLGAYFTSGVNRVELVADGEDELPYSMAIEYRSTQPADHPDAAIGVSTSLERTSVPMGEAVRLTAVATNRTEGPQPMTMVRVGIPGGLTWQTWQLKELREKGLIAFYETRPREVVLYLDGMGPAEVVELPLDLVATIPGTYTGPASSAYLYYTNDQKTWTAGLRMEITQASAAPQ